MPMTLEQFLALDPSSWDKASTDTRYSLWESYVELALVTEGKTDPMTGEPWDDSNRALHAGLGYLSEIGEIYDLLKKTIFYGKPFDKTNLIEEFGDLFWYCAIAHQIMGSDRADDIAKMEETQKYLDVDTTLAKLFDRSFQANARTLATLLVREREKTAGLGPRWAFVLMLATIMVNLTDFATPLRIWQVNLTKLQKHRYKNGQFTTEAALDRDTDAERTAMDNVLSN